MVAVICISFHAHTYTVGIELQCEFIFWYSLSGGEHEPSSAVHQDGVHWHRVSSTISVGCLPGHLNSAKQTSGLRVSTNLEDSRRYQILGEGERRGEKEEHTTRIVTSRNRHVQRSLHGVDYRN